MFDSKYDFENKRKYMNEDTRKRLIEIKYFLTFKPVYDIIESHGLHLGRHYGRELMEIIAVICGVSISLVITPFYLLYSRGARPTKPEIIIALRYFGLSYKEINKHYGFSHITVMKYVKNYFEDENVRLFPRMKGNSIHSDLEEALIPVHRFFLPISNICKVLEKAQIQNEDK